MKDQESNLLNIAYTIARICWRKGWLFNFGDFEDVFQEAIFIALKAEKKYNPEKGSLKAYLSRSIYNHMIQVGIENRLVKIPRSAIRKHKTIFKKIESLDFEILDKEYEYDDIEDMLQTLTPYNRFLICNRFGINCIQKNNAEIGNILGVSRETIRRQINSILGKLRCSCILQ